MVKINSFIMIIIKWEVKEDIAEELWEHFILVDFIV